MRGGEPIIPFIGEDAVDVDSKLHAVVSEPAGDSTVEGRARSAPDLLLVVAGTAPTTRCAGVELSLAHTASKRAASNGRRRRRQ